MRIVSRVTKLISEKQIAENRLISLSEISRETGLTRVTLYAWVKGDLSRFEAQAIIAFCTYFNCEIGDLLELVNDGGDEG